MNNNNKPINIESSLFNDVLNILQIARQKAYNAVNSEMVHAYWLLGKRIVEEEQQGEKRAAYGEGIIKELSKILSNELCKGFSVSNLENFRKFYLSFSDNQNSYALRRELGWSHYRLIMRIQNPTVRQYYMPYLPTEAELIAEIEREKRLIEMRMNEAKDE